MGRSVATTARDALVTLLLSVALVAGARAQTAGAITNGPFQLPLFGTKPITYSNGFNGSGPSVIRVTLSAPNILTTASLTLNGVQIMQLSNFANGVTQVDRFVTLIGQNTFSFTIAGTRGQSATLTVYQAIMPTPSSVTPNPLALIAGTVGTLTATLSPAPTAAGSLGVSSDNAAVATVPSSVAFAAGQASVAVPVTAVGTGSAAITVSANGGQASAAVNIAPATTVQSVTPATLKLATGASGTLTVAIAAAQTSDTTIALASSAPSVATVPASVVVAAGSVSVPFAVNAVAAGAAQVTASLGGSSAAGSVQVVAPPVVSGETPKDVILPGGSKPEIGATYLSDGSSVDPASVRLLFDGTDVTSAATVGASGVLYIVTQPLADATHTVSLTVADVLGGTSTQTWSFTVDDPAPNFHDETPRGVPLADRNPRIRVLLSGFGIVPSSVHISLDGNEVTAQADVGIDHIVYTPVTALADGNHTVSVSAADGRGATGSKQWTFTITTPPPPPTTTDGVRTGRTVTPTIRVLQ